MRAIRSAVITCAIALSAFAQNTPVNPPTPSDPGVGHPMPLPKQTPQPVPPNARQPDVRNEAGQNADKGSKSSKSRKTKSGSKSAPATDSSKR